MSFLATLKRWFLGDPNTWTSNYSVIDSQRPADAESLIPDCDLTECDCLRIMDVSEAEQEHLEALGGPDIFFGRLPPLKAPRKASKRKPAKSAATPAKKRKGLKTAPVKNQRVPKGAKQRKRVKA